MTLARANAVRHGVEGAGPELSSAAQVRGIRETIWLVDADSASYGRGTDVSRHISFGIFSTMVRWPVLETGRNSVSPSTIPRMMASKV